jgi:hypothetical protein
MDDGSVLQELISEILVLAESGLVLYVDVLLVRCQSVSMHAAFGPHAYGRWRFCYGAAWSSRQLKVQTMR